MIAKNLASGETIEVVEADKYVKRVIPEAEYMSEWRTGHVRAFYPIKSKNDEPQGYVYEINGKLYSTVSTNKHDELVEFYNKESKKPKQMTLFDYGIE